MPEHLSSADMAELLSNEDRRVVDRRQVHTMLEPYVERRNWKRRAIDRRKRMQTTALEKEVAERAFSRVLSTGLDIPKTKPCGMYRDLALLAVGITIGFLGTVLYRLLF